MVQEELCWVKTKSSSSRGDSRARPHSPRRVAPPMLQHPTYNLRALLLLLTWTTRNRILVSRWRRSLNRKNYYSNSWIRKREAPADSLVTLLSIIIVTVPNLMITRLRTSQLWTWYKMWSTIISEELNRPRMDPSLLEVVLHLIRHSQRDRGTPPWIALS